MSKRSSAARHRATPANANPLEAISKAVASNAGTVGRQAAVVAAASGLVLTIGMPAQGAAPAVRETTSIPAPGQDIERASLTTANVAAAKDVKVELDRASLSSKPAPEPEPEPEPVVQAPAEAPAQVTTASRSTERPAQESTESRQAAERSTESRQAAERPARQAAPERQAAPKPQSAPKPAATPKRASVGGVVGAAYSGIGTPYVYGGKTTAGWDCSGFVSWAYRQAGIDIPSSTSAIRGSGLFVRTSTPKPGDLVFQNGGGHVGIYVGNGQMIGAQNPSVGTFQHSVTRNPLYGYYTYVG